MKGESRVEDTRNLLVAKFRHETSRAQDPQLHTHALVLNLTRRSDGAWRALRNDEIVKATKYLGAVYRAELAAELQNLAGANGSSVRDPTVPSAPVTSRPGAAVRRLLGRKA